MWVMMIVVRSVLRISNLYVVGMRWDWVSEEDVGGVLIIFLFVMGFVIVIVDVVINIESKFFFLLIEVVVLIVNRVILI